MNRARTLRSLAIVTYAVDDLEAGTAVWTRWLGYRHVADGHVDAALARAWHAPAAAGRPFRLMRPASGEPVFVRYVETGERCGYGAPATAGWTATELVVEDPDGLARALARAPMTHLAGPGNLFPGPKAPRAMQWVGACGELLYFTRLLPGGSRYGIKGARCAVDRPFIVTVAGASLDAMQDFYGAGLGMRVMEPLNFINPILARTCGAPPETVFPTGLVAIPGRRCLIELDAFPVALPPRPRSPGQLPPGMALVGFRVASLDAVDLPLRAPPEAVDLPPYAGRRTAVVSGAAGEWLELIEGEHP